jgi:hypothetical protein
MMTSALIVSVALVAHVYGYGEMFCEDHGRPAPCVKGRLTSTGEIFDPQLITAALHMDIEKPFIMRIALAQTPSKCVPVRINDRKGGPGFDLTPGTLQALGVRPNRRWSGHVVVCSSGEITYVDQLSRAHTQF